MLGKSPKLAITAAALLLIQMAGLAVHPGSPGGALISNLVQVAANLLAAGCCFLAQRRSRAVARTFWGLMTTAFVGYGLSSALWAYFEAARPGAAPASILTQFLYLAYDVPLMLALLLDDEQTVAGLDWQRVLDFAQALIVILFVYFDLYYLPARRAGNNLVLDQVYVTNLVNGALAVAFVVRPRLSGSRLMGSLFRRMSGYMIVYALCAALADYWATYRNATSASWVSLAWTIPFLMAAGLASTWEGHEEEAGEVGPGMPSRLRIVSINLAPATIPLLVLVLALYATEEDRMVAFLAVLLSVGCYGARLSVSQYRQQQSLTALFESEERYRLLFEGVPVGVYRSTPEGEIQDANPAFHQMMGYPSLASVLAVRSTDLYVDPDERKLWSSLLERDGVVRNFEKRVRRRDGTMIWVRDSAHAVKDANGNILRYEGAVEDITEQKLSEQSQAEAEKALRESEAKFRALAETTASAIVLLQGGYIVYANPAAERIFGYPRQEQEKLRWLDVVHPEYRALVEKYSQARERGEAVPTRYEVRIMTKSGEERWVDWTAVVVEYEGKPSVLGTAFDVTTRRAAEQARALAETRYRALVEQLAAVTYISELGSEGRWLFVSPQIKTMLGFTPEEWMVDPRIWIEHVHPDDQAAVLEADRATLVGTPFRAEYRMYRRNRQLIWVNDTGMLVPDSTGKKLLLHGVLVDITEHKQMELQLRQSHKMEAVGNLAAGVAHDFNNLLTIVKGYSSLLVEQLNGQPDLAREVREVQQAADRAASLTRQLLAYSRQQVLQPRVLDLTRVVHDLEKMLRRVIGENIQIVTRSQPGLGSVKADPNQIEQVILNLAVNARDAMPEGGILTLEMANVELDDTVTHEQVTVRPGRYILLAVSDTGAGMDPETQAHIFEPFFTTKEVGKGTGLGLSTVYGIVKQSDGYVWVYSELEKGTTFKIYLPRVDRAAEIMESEGARAADKRGTETVLLVEDDPQLRGLAQKVLAGCGYKILSADSVQDAVEMCERQELEIHLLLTDVVMPGMSGRELARRVAPKRPAMKVMYMSGYTPDAIVHHGVLDPGTWFLSKPFTPAALREKVREVLDGVVANSQ